MGVCENKVGERSKQIRTGEVPRGARFILGWVEFLFSINLFLFLWNFGFGTVCLVVTSSLSCSLSDMSDYSIMTTDSAKKSYKQASTTQVRFIMS